MTEAEAILELRNELDDLIDTTVSDPPPSHLAIDEPVLGPCNGSNTAFRIRHIPVAGTASPFSLQVRDQDGNAIALASVNNLTGQFVTSAAPAAGKTLFAQYYYIYATSEQYRGFFKQGYRFIGASDIGGVSERLYPALFCFVKYLYYVLLSTKTGDFFNSSNGDQSIEKSEISPNYFKMATETKAEAFKLRDDVYQGQGLQYRPAYGYVAPSQPLYTPPR